MLRSLLLSLLTSLPVVAQEPGQAARVGAPAPPVVLRDLDGKRHALADQAGQVVVLEWTCHLCPAVAGIQEPGLAQDTRAAAAALSADEVVWWQVDSSWFARELADDVRAWRARHAFDGPLLVDEDGLAARALGASATPHLFVVDAEGVLVYRGLLCERGPEPARRNLVLEAVHAALAGEAPEIPETEARGCTLKLERGRWSAADYDEEREAHALLAQAAMAAGSDQLGRALELFEGALAAGLPRPERVLSDPAFRPLLDQDAARSRLRDLLRARPARGVLRMVAPDEPGTPLVLAGTVSNEDGRPIAGARVALYHTDAAGWYSAGTTDSDNPRLFGFVETGEEGRYRIRTVVPGAYADSGGPMHVHIGYRADGYRAHEGHRASVYFAHDPALVGPALAEIRGDGCTIAELERNAEGVALVVNDVVLRR